MSETLATTTIAFAAEKLKSFSSLPGGEDAEVNGPAPDDVEAYIQLGFAALQRYFESGTLVRNPDYETAESFLGSALGLLRADDPLRVEVSFALGAIRIAEHETRCASPCPAPEEVAPIVALLAPGGSMDDAPPDRLYPYALAVDKLYEHTHDRADISLAITWLSKAADCRGLPPEDRRRALIYLAVQHANMGDALRERRTTIASMPGLACSRRTTSAVANDRWTRTSTRWRDSPAA